jgi:hypothetical protein
MSVTIKNGIGYGVESGAMFFDVMAMSADTNPLAQTTLNKTTNIIGPWAPWGANNLLPFEMLDDIENCGILFSIIDQQARFALGEGVMWAYTKRDTKGKKEIVEFADIAEIDEFMEANDSYQQELALIKDMRAYNNAVVRFGLNLGRDKIELFQRDDVTEMRYEQLNAAGLSENIFLCAEWNKVLGKDDTRILTVPLLSRHNPLKDLRDRTTGGSGTSFALTIQYPGWNKKYYSMANWRSNKKWVDIVKGIPEMKAALFANNFRPKYKVTIFEKYWENILLEDNKSWQDYTQEEIEAKKQSVYDDINSNLAQNRNAYKTMFVDGWIDADGKEHSYVNIEPIEDPTSAGEMLPDSAAGNSEIAFSMNYNPAIVGATMPTGPYSNSNGGSNVREAVTVQVIMHEPERKNVTRLYNLISKFNKWDVNYAKDGLKLEPVIPATILQTLDTGSGVKPIMTGGVQPGEQKPVTPNS